ncbi:hypothetical protein HMH01_16880 [Halovulum dunhuangense]|uniref:Uncharacterized protein n=1 Tax=Halovulum dunhuangense TaxID=1505036 RepID=A0A849L7K2_9RHOB|nr:hypothetical protein [Halovulum dunhuangense]NNU82114.1 hypothetical protein [Halovulum dunhuangense]
MRFLALCVLVALYPLEGMGQDAGSSGSGVSADLNNQTQAAANGVFGDVNTGADFSNNSRIASAPGLTSFGAGPCAGSGASGSAGFPGAVALGFGRSSLDDSCTRRAWVQAILASSQQIPEMRSDLQRLAVGVMLSDPIVGEVAKDIGVFVDTGEPHRAGEPGVGTKAQGGCVVVLPKQAPALMAEVLKGRGCVARHM